MLGTRIPVISDGSVGASISFSQSGEHAERGTPVKDHSILGNENFHSPTQSVADREGCVS